MFILQTILPSFVYLPIPGYETISNFVTRGSIETNREFQDE
jgi:hypothetical protein